jgi:hypothetical protein
MIFLTSCGKTKYIYKTEIKEIEVPKLIPVDSKLTEPLIIPYWQSQDKPKYIDLKHLFIETRGVAQQCNVRLLEIRKSQTQTNQKNYAK